MFGPGNSPPRNCPNGQSCYLNSHSNCCRTDDRQPLNWRQQQRTLPNWRKWSESRAERRTVVSSSVWWTMRKSDWPADCAASSFCVAVPAWNGLRLWPTPPTLVASVLRQSVSMWLARQTSPPMPYRSLRSCAVYIAAGHRCRWRRASAAVDVWLVNDYAMMHQTDYSVPTMLVIHCWRVHL